MWSLSQSIPQRSRRWQPTMRDNQRWVLSRFKGESFKPPRSRGVVPSEGEMLLAELTLGRYIGIVCSLQMRVLLMGLVLDYLKSTRQLDDHLLLLTESYRSRLSGEFSYSPSLGCLTATDKKGHAISHRHTADYYNVTTVIGQKHPGRSSSGFSCPLKRLCVCVSVRSLMGRP